MSILLTAIMLSGTFLIPYLLVDFSINRTVIAKTLCVNKDKPITVCGGQCYLDSQLSKAAGQQEKEKTLNVKPIPLSIFNPENPYVLDHHQRNHSLIVSTPVECILIASPHLFGTFRPPC